MANDIISTKNVWPYYDAANVKAATNKPKDNTLGKDDFLKILVEQLKNQNPAEPLQDRDFIAQMAQFSSVEQLMNMAGEMSSLRQSLGFVSSLIGKEVAWVTVDDTGATIPGSGVVDAVIIRDGAQYVKVGGADVKVDDLTAIADRQEAEPSGG
jgi:flagellar basal-body rod modification protein FlgD